MYYTISEVRSKNHLEYSSQIRQRNTHLIDLCSKLIFKFKKKKNFFNEKKKFKNSFVNILFLSFRIFLGDMAQL